MSKELIKGIINAVSGIKEHNGQTQIGWILKENPKKWYNATGEESELKNLLETIIITGNTIEFNYDTLGTKVTNLVRLEEAKSTGNKSWEDDIIDFKTLLSAAHEKSKGEFSIKTEMLGLDLEKKYALFKAKVIIGANPKAKIGELEIEPMVFEGHGDATEENVTGDFIKPHFIRMAETRAICRALRWYTNNATCSEEEKSDEAPEPEEKPKPVEKSKAK